MSRFPAVLLALPCVFSLGLATTGGLAGRWKLVEQRYEGGGDNFARGAPGFVLEFTDDGVSAAGRVRFAGWEAAWPVWPAPYGPAHASAASISVDRARAAIRSSYRVDPAPGDDTFLVVTESCAVRDDDRLGCEVRVQFERAGVTAGGFTWHRVFVREATP